MKEWFTPAEFAAAELPEVPQTKRGVAKLAERQDWDSAVTVDGRELSRRRSGRGGGREYHYRVLPKCAQVALVAQAHKDGEMLLSASATATIEPEPEGFTEKDALRRDAKLEILSAFDAYVAKTGLPIKAAEHSFCIQYNADDAGLPDWVKTAKPSVGARTLARWRKARRAGRLHQLAGQYASRKGSGVLHRANSGEVATFIAALIVRQPHLTGGHVRDLMRDKFGETLSLPEGEKPIPPLRTIQRFMSDWKAEHQGALLRLTDPDRYKSKLKAVGHDMNAHATAPNMLWEIDASPADVLTLDGRYSLYVVVDIYTRRMMALVTKTPRTQAALLLVRRAITAWGVPETLRTDNGSDFVSHAFKRALNALAIQQDITPPFSPERKGTVERAIGTMQRGLMPLLPGFVGHSVADRKKIEARKAFAERLGESDDKAFCVDLTSLELQDLIDRWVAKRYEHAAHKGIEGETPFERAANWSGTVRRIENERALDILLAPVAGRDGFRVVMKQGIKLDGGWFIHPDLEPGERVLCRQDPEDLGRLYVFAEEAERFICVAECPERLGIDPAAAVARVKAVQKKRMAEEVEPLRREIRKIKPRDLVEGVLRVSEQDNAALVAFPKPAEGHNTDELAAAAEAAIEGPPRPRQWSPEEDANYAALVAEIEAGPAPDPTQEGPRDRFERWLDVDARVTAGTAGDDERAWWASYQETAEFRAERDVAEEFGLISKAG